MIYNKTNFLNQKLHVLYFNSFTNTQFGNFLYKSILINEACDLLHTHEVLVKNTVSYEYSVCVSRVTSIIKVSNDLTLATIKRVYLLAK